MNNELDKILQGNRDSKKENITLYLPKELIKRLKSVSSKSNVSLSVLVKAILEDTLNSKKL
jgi:hypothetical protein